VERGGRHPGGTENALGILGSGPTYVELVAAVDPPTPGSWAELVGERAGPLTYAIGSDDLDRDVERLRRIGAMVHDAEPGQRECLDGQIVRWRSAILGGDSISRNWPFLIEWPSTGPERLGIGRQTSAPSLVVTELLVAVPEPEELVQVLVALGWESVPANGRCVAHGVTRIAVEAAELKRSGPRGLKVAGAGADVDVVIDGLRVRLSRVAPRTREE